MFSRVPMQGTWQYDFLIYPHQLDTVSSFFTLTLCRSAIFPIQLFERGDSSSDVTLITQRIAAFGNLESHRICMWPSRISIESIYPCLKFGVFTILQRSLTKWRHFGVGTPHDAFEV